MAKIQLTQQKGNDERERVKENKIRRKCILAINTLH